MSKTDNELKEFQNEIMQKIGENLLLFQKIEELLKHCVSITNILGYSDEIPRVLSDKKQKLDQATMGGLVSQFQKDLESEVEENHHNVGESSKIHISCSFRIKNSSFYENLILLREGRNRLVHHFSEEWHLDTIEQCKDAMEHLAQQYQNAELIRNELIDKIKFFVESYKSMCEAAIAKILQDSMIETLIDTHTQKKKNGWTSFTFANQRLSSNLSKESIKQVYYTFNCKNLRDFMIKTNIFDFCDEPTDKGKKTTYRIKSNVNLDNLDVLMPELFFGTDQIYKLQEENR